MERINVTKTFLPPKQEYLQYLDRIWKNGQLTNQGAILTEFEKKASDYLEVDNFQFVTNGTVALQIALRSLDITGGEVITTPFSYVATTSAILWERCTPVYVDIDPSTLCIDSSKIEAAITKNTKAILAVHVFGNACNIEAIDVIARKYNLKIIYDGAHAFGATYRSRSLLSYGDITTCSFHSTKLFHTIEGGCIIAQDDKINRKIELIKRFGHHGDKHITLGINAKASEFNAAMGLCNLKYIEKIILERKKLSRLYDRKLSNIFNVYSSSNNYPYYPVLFSNEEHLRRTVAELAKANIFPRRYFFPSLNTLPYLTSYQQCPVSEDISKRILCLPLYPGLSDTAVDKITGVVLRA